MATRQLVVAALLASSLPVAAAEWPKPVQDAIAEREAYCREQGGTGIELADFVGRLDLDGDKRDDFILDDGKYRCSKGPPGYCGSGGCSMTVWLSKPEGGPKIVLETLGDGYALSWSRIGATIAFPGRGGKTAYRFAKGCAVAVPGGEKSC